MTPDQEQLSLYAEKADEAAFAELVRRYVDLTYSAAVRMLGGDRQLAQDVVQEVFTDLARKAWPLSRHPTLAGWLHTSVRYAALKTLRRERRRQTREQEATAMQEYPAAPEPDWEQLRPVLDEAVSHLNARDRNAILLRYFQRKNHREIGTALGLSEEAARKIVERALEKLRAHFSRRGVPVSSSLLAAAISAHALETAPVGLVATLTASALLTGAAAPTWFGTLLAAFLTMTTTTKITVAFALIVAAAIPSYYYLHTATTPRQPMASNADKTAHADALPKVEAAPAPAATAAAETSPPTTAADPQTDLATAIPDIIRLMQSIDYFTMMKTYIPPDKWAQIPENELARLVEETRTINQNPLAQQRMQIKIQALESIRGATPTFDATGENVTFTPIVLPGGPTAITFTKLNGRWYFSGRWYLNN